MKRAMLVIFNIFYIEEQVDRVGDQESWGGNRELRKAGQKTNKIGREREPRVRRREPGVNRGGNQRWIPPVYPLIEIRCTIQIQ